MQEKILPISIKEARKLIGKEAESLNDDQIELIIRQLTDVAIFYLHKNGSTKLSGKI